MSQIKGPNYNKTSKANASKGFGTKKSIKKPYFNLYHMI